MSTGSLLRISTAGSVDDGKSTLIGRLLHDCQAIMEDQWDQLSSTKQEGIDLAALTDGLKSEREQGITIDVAYKYFSTPKRKFILADTPGHVQYTRNMATGASTADVAIILIDARQGLTEQTRRHVAISSMLKIPRLIFAINKMDLVDFSQDRFDELSSEVRELATRVSIESQIIIPMSALDGDNVTTRTSRSSWYEGPTLLETLESIEVSREKTLHGRLAVQYVIRPNQNFRGFAGKLTEGSLKVGDPIKVFPESSEATIKSIYRGGVELEEARQGQSVVIELKEDRDVQTGSILSHGNNDLATSTQWEGSLVWFSENPCLVSKPYILKHRSRHYRVQIERIRSKLNLSKLEDEKEDSLRLNDIGKVVISSQSEIGADVYSNSRLMGSFLLIDPHSFQTIAAGSFLKALESDSQETLSWHYIDTENTQLLEKLEGETDALVISSQYRPESPNQDLWWLSQIANNKITLITNRAEFLDFQQGVEWQTWTEENFNNLRTHSLAKMRR